MLRGVTDRQLDFGREAKGLQQGLKELLKTRDITDREIDIQRKKCVTVLGPYYSGLSVLQSTPAVPTSAIPPSLCEGVQRCRDTPMDADILFDNINL